MKRAALIKFLEESNRIEGVHGVEPYEYAMAQVALNTKELVIADLQRYVSACTKGILRAMPGADVWVGDHQPIPGGSEVVRQLTELLKDCAAYPELWHEKHLQYEHLHPFTDGNGRSGRLLWLWMRRKAHQPTFTFLQQFYYDTLEAYRT